MKSVEQQKEIVPEKERGFPQQITRSFFCFICFKSGGRLAVPYRGF
jgi:hypothetical protein